MLRWCEIRFSTLVLIKIPTGNIYKSMRDTQKTSIKVCQITTRRKWFYTSVQYRYWCDKACIDQILTCLPTCDPPRTNHLYYHSVFYYWCNLYANLRNGLIEPLRCKCSIDHENAWDIITSFDSNFRINLWCRNKNILADIRFNNDWQSRWQVYLILFQSFVFKIFHNALVENNLNKLNDSCRF